MEYQVSQEGQVSLVPLDQEERLGSLDHKEALDCPVVLEAQDPWDPLVLLVHKDSLEHPEALVNRVHQVRQPFFILS